MDEHYLFLSSDQSKDRYPSNEPGDFTVELPRTYHLQGHWICSLKEIQIPVRSDIVYVCSDICGESYAENTMLPILGALQKPSGKSVVTHFLFDNPMRMKIKPTIVNRVRIFIRDSQLKSFEVSKTVRCTVHLKKWK